MLQRLFCPKRIAIIGASHIAGKVGHDIFINARNGFRGDVYPVNPSVEKIQGVRCFKKINDIKTNIDVAVIVVPAAAVADVLRECGKKRIPFAVIISAGFREIGEEGRAAEKVLQQIAKKYRIQIVGPNCLGFLNPWISLNASFASGMPKKGNIALVSQSGAMAVAMLDWAAESKLGFSKIVSIGNKAGITEVELLEYLGADKQTEVIMMYLESIEAGRAFMAAASRVALRKPIVVLKAGASTQAQRAVSSHTGALAGSDEAITAAFEKVGVLRVRTVEEFFDSAMVYSFSRRMHGRNGHAHRIVIITNAGGPGIMAVDSATALPITVAELSHTLQSRLSARLPEAAQVKNPVDLLGDAPADRYALALRTVCSSKEVDGVVVLATPQVMTDVPAIAKQIVDAAIQYKKPVVASLIGGHRVHAARTHLEVNHIAHYDTPERAVRAISYLAIHTAQSAHVQPFSLSIPRPRKRLSPEGHHVQLRTIETEQILAAYALPVVYSRLIKKVDDCKTITTFPVAMKIASRDVIHKARYHAVELNIQSVQEARAAYKRIFTQVRAQLPAAEIEGILVQPFHHLSAGAREIIIGMKRDPSFGPVMLFGLGGSAVELLHDVSFGIAPVSKQDALGMIHRIRTAPLLAHCDISFAARVLQTVSRLALEHPDIMEMDINPLILDTRGRKGVILDARMMVY